MRETLHEQIAANKRASAFYAFLIVLLLAAMGTAIAGSVEPDFWWAGTAGATGLGLIVALVARVAGPGIVLSVSGAREANPQEDRVLRNVGEEMAIAAGMPMPKLYVIDDSAPNAFATGTDPKNGVVCFTSGLINKLNRDELQGVMAHEMAHIRNYDIRLMTTLAMVAGLIPLLADMFWRFLRGGGGRKSKNDQAQIIFLVFAVVLSILAPLFAKLLEMAVSRQREFLADATAAHMTRYPEGLASALEKISHDHDVLEAANRATQHMYIVNPFKPIEDRAKSLFSTHPPLEQRVFRLRGIMGQRDAEAVEPPRPVA
ncbi:MAG TPA: M48 family metallopeptidase [Fimbriimonadaceae bacterium]|nr:M48 family metallopeptidase [Fimbriimonadaceae bacterium]